MLAMRIREFCEAVGISQRTFWNLKARGDAPAMVAVGSIRLITPESAAAWLKAHEEKRAA